MSRPSDVVVVGGGVIGLSIAWRLACAEVGVTLIDRRAVGREASWAGAGLIAANSERLKTNSSVELRSWSAVLFPEWSASLLAETGIDIGYRRCGGVDVALTESEDTDLRSSAGRWRTEGIVFERLAPADYSRVEPALGPNIRAAYFLPDRAQIRNPRFLKALQTAARGRGVSIRTDEPVVGFETQSGRVVGVVTQSGTTSCGTLVLAAGAWTGGLAEGLGVRLATPPVKGQIVLLRSEKPLLRRIVEHGSNYLVPRDDGRLLIGATEEDAGFDTRPTLPGVRDLIDEAHRLCPILATAELELTWAGLRPGSQDTRPYLGSLPGFTNAFVASGHKRAGLQLSPATAEVIVDVVLGREPRIDLTAFRVDRSPAAADEEAFRS